MVDVAGRCWPLRPHKWERWQPTSVTLHRGHDSFDDRDGQQRDCLRCGKRQVRVLDA
jgi:hypothetical protein